MATSPTDASDDLLRVVGQLNRWASRSGGHDAPLAQLRLLALLDDLGPSRISDLANADHCSQPTMTAQVQRLEREGLLRRSPDPVDQRASLVAITAEGRSRLTRARTQRGAALAPVVTAAGLREADLRAATATLRALLDAAAT